MHLLAQEAREEVQVVAVALVGGRSRFVVVWGKWVGKRCVITTAKPVGGIGMVWLSPVTSHGKERKTPIGHIPSHHTARQGQARLGKKNTCLELIEVLEGLLRLGPLQGRDVRHARLPRLHAVRHLREA